MPEKPSAERLARWRDFCFREAVMAQERNEDGRFWVGSVSMLDVALAMLDAGDHPSTVKVAMQLMASSQGMPRSEWGRGASAAAYEIAEMFGG